MSSGRPKSKLSSALGLGSPTKWRTNPLSSAPGSDTGSPADTGPPEGDNVGQLNPAFGSRRGTAVAGAPHGAPRLSSPPVEATRADDGDDTVAEEMGDSVHIPVRMTPLEVEQGDKAATPGPTTARKARASTYRKANSNANLFRPGTALGGLPAMAPASSSAPAPAPVTNPLNAKAASFGASGETHSDRQLTDRKGIPVREGLQAVYKVYRDRNIMEGFFFVLMFALFIINVNVVNDVTIEFESGAAIQAHVVDEDINAFASWEKTFSDLVTQGDVYEWLFNVLYPAVYLRDFPGQWTQNTPVGVPDVQAWNIPANPNISNPIVLGNFQAVGGVRLRQLRVSRDSCVERRTVGRYYVPEDVFYPSAINLPGSRPGNVGVQGGSTLNSYYAPFRVLPPEGETPYTGLLSDGGSSATRDLSYGLGCMNYWALTKTCPSDVDATEIAATVMINPAPVANITTQNATARVAVPVSFTGRIKCALHNVTDTLARSVYAMYNPLHGGSYNASVTRDRFAPGYVQACLGRFDTLDGSCATTFDTTTEQTVPFVGLTGTVYPYTAMAAKDNLASMLGWGPSSGYGTGGYLVHLSNDPDYAAAALARLYWDHWIDKQTRAVTADINLWNANTRMGSTFRVVFEFLPSGYLTKYLRIYTYRILDHDTATNFMVYLISIAFVLFWLFFWFIEGQRLRYSFNTWAYVSSFRNLYVCTLLVLAGVYIWSWIDYVFVVDMYSRMVNVFHAGTYVDLFDVAEKYQTMFTLSGLLGLGFFLKLFEYLGMNKRMRSIWFTLYDARIELLAFMLGFLLLVYGFSFAGQFIFGYSSVGFHNAGASMSTLLRFPLGDFDYDSSLYDSRPALAPWFFVAFLAMIFLVSLNIAIAILTTSFDRVHETTKSVDRWKESATSIDEDMLYLFRVKLKVWTRPLRRWCVKRCCKRLQRRGTGTGSPSRTPSPASGSGMSPTNEPRNGSIAAGTTVVNPVGPGNEEPQKRKRTLSRKSFLELGQSARSIATFFGSAPRASSGSLEASQQEEDETEREIVAYKDAASFYAMINKCVQAALIYNNIDLFSYIKRLYENERDSDKLCIGEDELCELTSKEACGRRNHELGNCLAFQTCETFYKLKTVLTTGNAAEHTTPWEAITRAKRKAYKLVKINKMGQMQARIFFIALSSKLETDGAVPEEMLASAVDREGGIDPDGPPIEAVLYNFDERHRLKKKLPLRQMIQIEKSQRNDKRLTLVFSSQGGAYFLAQDEEDGAGLETTYHLIFRSAEEKAAFEKDILIAHARSMESVDAVKSLDDLEAMTSKKTAAKSRTRASTKRSETSLALQESLRRSASRHTLVASHSAHDARSMWKSAYRNVSVLQAFAPTPKAGGVQLVDGTAAPPRTTLSPTSPRFFGSDAEEPSLPSHHTSSPGDIAGSVLSSVSVQRAQQMAQDVAGHPGARPSQVATASQAMPSFFGGDAGSPAPATSRPTFFN